MTVVSITWDYNDRGYYYLASSLVMSCSFLSQSSLKPSVRDCLIFPFGSRWILHNNATKSHTHTSVHKSYRVFCFQVNLSALPWVSPWTCLSLLCRPSLVSSAVKGLIAATPLTMSSSSVPPFIKSWEMWREFYVGIIIIPGANLHTTHT